MNKIAIFKYGNHTATNGMQINATPDYLRASFYPPEHPCNPTQGKSYLHHVGFLGA